ncbi:MAG: hypothetical protein ACE5IY_12375 [bacterium]
MPGIAFASELVSLPGVVLLGRIYRSPGLYYPQVIKFFRSLLKRVKITLYASGSRFVFKSQKNSNMCFKNRDRANYRQMDVYYFHIPDHGLDENWPTLDKRELREGSVK